MENVKLPELVGSEKQIAWAEKIRIEMMKASGVTETLLTNSQNLIETKPEQVETALRDVEKFWKDQESLPIGNRHSLPAKIIRGVSAVKVLMITDATYYINNRNNREALTGYDEIK